MAVRGDDQSGAKVRARAHRDVLWVKSRIQGIVPLAASMTNPRSFSISAAPNPGGGGDSGGGGGGGGGGGRKEVSTRVHPCH